MLRGIKYFNHVLYMFFSPHSITNTVTYIVKNIVVEHKSVCSLCMFYKGVGILGSCNHAFSYLSDLTVLFPVHSYRNPKSHSHF